MNVVISEFHYLEWLTLLFFDVYHWLPETFCRAKRRHNFISLLYGYLNVKVKFDLNQKMIQIWNVMSQKGCRPSTYEHVAQECERG